MTDRLHLSARHRGTLQRLLQDHLPDVQAWAYGSRVNGRSHEGSNLDLALRALGKAEIPAEQLADFKDAVRDSEIPFLVEVRDWTRLPGRSQREIESDHVAISGGVESAHQPGSRWSTATIGEISEKVGMGPFGSSIKVETFVPIGVPIITGQHLHGPRVDDTPGFNFVTEKHASKLANAIVQSGDIVLTHRGTIGQAAYVPADSQFDRYVVSQSQFFLRCDRSKALPEFVAGYFKSPAGRHKLLANASQVGVPSIAQPVTYLRTVEIPLPPLSEQRGIAAILGALNDKTELNRRMNETLEAMARALFKSWFTDFEPVRAKMEGRDPRLPHELADLFPERMIDSELGEIPDGWGVRPLSDLIDVNPLRRLPKGQVAPYLAMANTPVKGHVPSTVVNRPFGSGMRFANGDTLVARITPCLENGKAAYVDFLSDEEIGWGSTEYIVMRPREPLPTEFAYLLARTTRFREFAILNMTGTSGRQRVQAQAVRQFLLVDPPERVAVAFGKLVRPLLAKASAGVRGSASLDAVRDALLPKLISGEIRVPIAESAREVAR